MSIFLLFLIAAPFIMREWHALRAQLHARSVVEAPDRVLAATEDILAAEYLRCIAEGYAFKPLPVLDDSQPTDFGFEQW